MLKKIIKRCIFDSIKNFFKVSASRPVSDKNKDVHNTGCDNVVIVSGFGYGNLGDEAQLSFNLDRWRNSIQPERIVALSPNPDFTREYHNVSSFLASRAVIFGSDKPCGSWVFPEKLFTFAFIFNFSILTIATYFIKFNIHPFFISNRKLEFLYRIKNASVVHVSGGGFMTGKTRTRLLDTLLVLFLSRKFETPFFLTGQTFGLINSKLDGILIKKVLNSAIHIGLRDPVESKKELVKLGIKENLIHNSVDDALFSKKLGNNKLNNFLNSEKIDKDNFVVINYHWWGMSEEVKVSSSSLISELIDYLHSFYNYQVVLLPMHETDLEALYDLRGKVKKAKNVKVLPYQERHEVVRGLISEAQFLVSLKHHPVIFAIGESVPVMAVSYDRYYSRKNIGALSNAGMEKYIVEYPSLLSDFTILIDDLLSNHLAIVESLKGNNKELILSQQLEFEKVVSKIKSLRE